LQTLHSASISSATILPKRCSIGREQRNLDEPFHNRTPAKRRVFFEFKLFL